MTGAAASSVSVVIPNWNGRRWLPGVLGSLRAQRELPAEVIVVDNGSEDDSLAFLAQAHPDVRVIALGENTGFAHAANRGVAAASGEFVALLNTDVELADDWIARTAAVLAGDPGAAAVATKMLELSDPGRVYDAGDVLRRDGACLQRGRFGRDDGRWDEPGEVFGACAGAALYRRSALRAEDGFDERYFAYLEDADLALRLRLAGWRCRYEPVVALHAGEGSSGQLSGGHHFYVARNTVLLVAKTFPLRWLPFVLYRQLAWLRIAARSGTLAARIRGLAAGFAALPGVLAERRRLAPRRRRIAAVVPAMPIRGPDALGHPSERGGGAGEEAAPERPASRP